MGRTLFDKIWDLHEIARASSGATLIAIDRIFLHERTGAAALARMAQMGRKVHDPSRVFAVMDHIVNTRPDRSASGPTATLVPGGRAFLNETRAACRKAGITLFDIGDPAQGIVHVVSAEQGIVLPGMTLVAPDSHTCTQGAFGALAFGIGSSEAEHAMVTGTLRMKRPQNMLVHFTGRPAPGVTPKDMILALIAGYGAGGGAGCVLEFDGDSVRELDMEGRMTLCNMATEFGALTAIVAPDEKTFSYLEGRRYAPDSFDHSSWTDLRSDKDAVFQRRIEIDASDIAPMVSWGTSPEHSIPVTGRVPQGPQRAHDYIGLAPGHVLAGTPIDAAFIGSCTNARISDLRRAAAILRGRRIAGTVQKALVVPGSTEVRRQAEAEGLDKVFVEAGFEWRMSGCSLCFYAGGEGFPEGARVISSTNRNFEGRQGPSVRTHIASPETVAASAIAGVIADPRPYRARS